MTRIEPGRLRVDVAPGGDPARPLSWSALWQPATVRESDAVRIRRGVQSEGQSTESIFCEVKVDNRDGRWVPENPLGEWFGLIGEDSPLRAVWDGDRRAETQSTNYDGGFFADPWREILIDPFDAPSVDALAPGLLLCGWGSQFGTNPNWQPPLSMTAGEQSNGSSLSFFRTAWESVSAGATGVRSADHDAAGSSSTSFASFSVVLPGATSVLEEIVAPNNQAETEVELVTAPMTAVGNWIVAIMVRSDESDRDNPKPPGGDPGFWRQLVNAQRASNRPTPDSTIFTPAFYIWARPVTEAGANTVTLASTFFTNDQLRILVVDNLDVDNLIWLGIERFVGFISELPLTWDRSGNDATAVVRADGVLRRLQAGQPRVASAIREHVTRTLEGGFFIQDPAGYWPLEETDLTSPLEDVSRLTGTELQPGQAPDTPPSSLAMLRIPTGSRWQATPLSVAPSTSSFARLRVTWLYFMDEPPPGTSTRVAMRVYTTHDHSQRFDIRTTATDFNIRRFDDTGTQVSSVSETIFEDFYGNWHVFEFDLFISAGNLAYSLDVAGIDDDALTNIFSFSTGNAADDVGRITQLGPVGPMAQDRAMGHLIVATTSALRAAVQGRVGELAADRLTRLADEQNMPAEIVGDSSDSIAMGVQVPDALVALLRSTENADDGLLNDFGAGLVFRTRASLYNQEVALPLQLVRDGRPIRDDRLLATDVTVERPLGGSARAVAPGVRRETRIIANVENDLLLQSIAQWHLHKGTQPLLRWPRIRIQLHADPSVLEQWLTFELGDRLAWQQNLIGLTGVDVDVLAVGFEERISSFEYDIDINAVTAAPYIAAEFGSEESGQSTLRRFGTNGSELAEDVSESATTFLVNPESQAINHDPGFEDPETTDLWDRFDTIFVSSVAQAFDGERSGLMIPTEATAPAEISSLSGESEMVITAQGALEYQASAWVFAPNGVPSTVTIFLIFGDDGGSFSNSVAVPTGAWTYLVVRATPDQPNETTFVGMNIRIDGEPFEDNRLHVDQARISLVYPLWTTDAANLPLDMKLGGEQVTVTNITGATAPQTFTVTRGVNGIARAHQAGTSIRLTPQPNYVL